MKTKAACAIAKGLLIGAALITIATLTGCAEYPLAVRIQGNHGVYGYSAKSGITIETSLK